ncbi:PKS-NRPS hybrid synthetase CHGG_01239 [Cajanus cajan]|uniref:PKS-NRPS hybrid synthetase CHGG_01239 n=1 Tax=Cajanus cajan TaxID=3821 RepID=UPI00098D8FBF|nr:PKS-NRPS hybrid synthetase CHGG_01239 [Cajanus cajan]
MCGYHNHDLAETLVGHSYAGRLSAEEKSLVGEMTKNMVKPRNILLTLKDRNVHNLSTIRHIYNYRQAYRSSMKGSRTEMQHLLKLLERDKYVYWYRKVDNFDVIKDIFWSHPDSIKLFGTFHTILLIDSTYKTNRYGLSLLEIVGVTSTKLTFSMAFAYVMSERVDNFTWALQKLKGLITNDNDTPQVIVTDRDLGMMKALQMIFPSSTNLLCRFHINKNVKAKCKMVVYPKEKWDLVMDAWDDVVNSSNEDQYVQRLTLFEKVCSNFPIFNDYVRDSWLIPHKEKFVTAWTNKVMHLGNTTTNRVEAAHWRLKMFLQHSRGNMCNCWDAMNNMITLQHTEIKSSFEKSINVVEHRHNNSFYIKLRGFVSRNALSHIAYQYDRVKTIGIDSSICGCTIRTTHGLPCACELARYSTMCQPIPLDTIHSHWKRLNFGDQGKNHEGNVLSLQPYIDALLKRFMEVDNVGKVTILEKLRELAFPDTTSLYPPPEKVKTKGAPKGSGSKRDRSTKRDPSFWEHVDAVVSIHDSTSTHPSSYKSTHDSKRRKVLPFMDSFPIELHPFIEDIIDVKADGNCGYRAVAAQLGMGEESWSLVRQDLIKELQQWKDDYVELFGSVSRVDVMRQSLYVDTHASVDKWMTLPDMGYVIASRYKVVLVTLSSQQSMTFFPLRGSPPLSKSSHRLITIGFVSNCHFVQVILKAEAALPPIALQWSRYCKVESRFWQTPYISRMQQKNKDLLAWWSADMPGIDPNFLCHKLSVCREAKPVAQQKRKTGEERKKAIEAEVSKLMEAGFI